MFKNISEITFPSLPPKDLHLDTLWHALRFNPKIEPESRSGWSGYMLMMSSRDYLGNRWFICYILLIQIQTTCPIFTHLYLLLFKSHQPLWFKGCVCYIFASLFGMSNRQNLWNKAICFFNFTSKAHFVLKIIKF